MSVLEVTPLYDLHRESGARFAPFAGYDMPIQYRDGILAEHAHTRAKAGLFDVSHMGQAILSGPDYPTVAAALERLCPADLQSLAPGRQRYSQLLNVQGGVIDDFMVFRTATTSGVLHLILNAARKDVDSAHIAANLPAGVSFERRDDLALLAIQGPGAAAALCAASGFAMLASLPFMGQATILWDRKAVYITRSGYTGEDGFEISAAADRIEGIARQLLAQPDVALIGLGARDTLRLEAGLCLYGHELTEETDPIEAALAWSIPKRRRIDGGFPGAARIQAALAQGPQRVRIGLKLDGRAPARDGAEIVAPDGASVGVVTSGGFGPSVGAAIAMGFVARGFSAPGTELAVLVRNKNLPARVVALPFHPHAYFRG